MQWYRQRHWLRAHYKLYLTKTFFRLKTFFLLLFCVLIASVLLAFWLAIIPPSNWLFHFSQSKASTARATVLWSVTTHDKLCAAVWVPADVDFVDFFRQNSRTSRIVLGDNATGELSAIHNDDENKQIKRGTVQISKQKLKAHTTLSCSFLRHYCTTEVI